MTFSDPSRATTQTDRLELQSKIIGYIKDALIYDKGYMILELSDSYNGIIDYYYSSGKEIKSRYEETREETVERIVYVINCEQLKGKEFSDSSLNNIMNYLYAYVTGYIAANELTGSFGITDHSYVFDERI